MNVFETLPPISPRMGFLRTVSGWLDAALVEFGPEGTMHYAQSALQGGAENLFTSGMEERQVIFGDTRPLEDALRAVDAARAPGLLFLTSSPVSEIIGADLEQVRRQLQPGLRARLSVWDRVPVQGTEQDGQRSAYAAGADYLRTLPPKADRGAAGGVVVLGLDQTDWNGRSDLNELRRMFADYFGLACRNDPQGRYRLEELRSARLLLAASPAALPLAEAAQALWGVPVCRGLPYGVRGSARLVESVSRLLEQAPSPAWSADRREAEQAVREFQFALRPWPKRELRLLSFRRTEAFRLDAAGARVSDAASSRGGPAGQRHFVPPVSAAPFPVPGYARPSPAIVQHPSSVRRDPGYGESAVRPIPPPDGGCLIADTRRVCLRFVSPTK